MVAETALVYPAVPALVVVVKQDSHETIYPPGPLRLVYQVNYWTG
jgi:hypothetical protein